MNCGGCLHQTRDLLDAQLVAGVSYRSIAKTFHLSLGSISRHRRHVKEMIQARTPAEVSEHGSALLDRVQKLVGEAESILATAKARDDFRAANGALGAACKLLDLCARLSGELQSVSAGAIHLSMSKTVNVNMHVGDDTEIAQLVFEATQGFDETVIQGMKALVACTDRATPIVKP